MMRSGGRGRPDVSSAARQSDRSARPSREGFRPSTRGSVDARQQAQRSIDSARQRSSAREGSISRQAQGRGSRSLDDAARSARSRQPNIGRREYQAARPTNDQVRDFLRMRQDGRSRQAQDLRGRAGDARDAIRGRDEAIGDRTDRVGDRDRGDLTGRIGDQNRRDGTGRIGDRDRGDVTGRIGDRDRGDLRDRIGDADRRGDRDFGRGDRDVARGDRGDRDFDRGDRGDRDIDRGDRGDRDFGRGDRNRDIARRDGDRDRDYRRWREGAWTRDGDLRGDNRDWSGRWRRGDRFDKAWQVRNRWRDRWSDRWRDRNWNNWNDFPFYVSWFTGRNWYGPHWGHWGWYARSRPWYWWTWVGAPRLYSWFDYGWNTPYYWDYGHGEYIYHDDGVVYVNGQWYQPAPVFYENTVEIIEEAPTLTEDQAAQAEWLPLGVFAITREGQADADLMVQLAVTQDGIIGGTVHDQARGLTYQVEGTVEKETQRAVWSYTNDRNQRILMETSIFNLTQPEATGLVHYSPDDIQVIEMVRLEPPEGASVAVEGELPAPPAQ